MFISASSPDYSLPFKSVGRQTSNLVPELLLGSGFDGDTALLQIRSDSIGVPAPRVSRDLLLRRLAQTQVLRGVCCRSCVGDDLSIADGPL